MFYFDLIFSESKKGKVEGKLKKKSYNKEKRKKKCKRFYILYFLKHGGRQTTNVHLIWVSTLNDGLGDDLAGDVEGCLLLHDDGGKASGLALDETAQRVVGTDGDAGEADRSAAVHAAVGATDTTSRAKGEDVAADVEAVRARVWERIAAPGG